MLWYVMVWYGMAVAPPTTTRARQTVVKTANGNRHPAIQDIYRTWCLKKADKITLDSSYPALLKISFYPCTIRPLNSLWASSFPFPKSLYHFTYCTFSIVTLQLFSLHSVILCVLYFNMYFLISLLHLCLLYIVYCTLFVLILFYLYHF